MKKTASIIATTAAAALFSTASWGAVVFGDGGAALQGVLDGITTTGPSSVNVTTDEVSPDAYWAVGGSGTSISTVVIEIASLASTNTFGVYEQFNTGKKVELFGGAATTGSTVTLSILADGSVLRNFIDTGVDFASNAFGYYLDNPTAGFGGPATFYSDTSKNADGLDHMAAYQGVGDQIQILPFAPGPWGANEYILAWEDVVGGGDRDFTDFVVLVESVSPVPVPATLALMGLGLLGFAARRRKA